jgi:predicted lipid-binding transport protein (Tim44 family)
MTSGVAMAGGACMGSGVVVFVRAGAAIRSLPMVAELLTFGAFVCWGCRKVFLCPPWLTENCYSMFPESL